MPLTLVAENITVTDPAIQRAVTLNDPLPLIEIARLAKSSGVTALDINLGPAKNRIAALEFALNALTGHWDGELWIDGADMSVMETAASLRPGGLVLNGYAGGTNREGILRLAAKLGLDLVVFLMTDKGMPKTVEERLALAAELVGRAGEAGIPPEKLIIDPVLAPMGWMDGQELNSQLKTLIGSLKELFGDGIRTVVGLSNLVTRSTGTNGANGMDEIFLAYAVGTGLTHAMINIKNKRILRTAAALNVFEGNRPYAPGEFT